ncbi:MAG: SHD1 domain-containing protein, partial [Pirellulaceae bacterium]|nr:SHD1 domain-containing protein [Pirellulaceae bacterium]
MFPWLRLFIVVFALAVVAAPLSARAAEYKVGDLIEVAYLGEWRKATVVQTNQRGEVLAEYEFAGRSRREVFNPMNVRFQYEGTALSKGRMWSDASGQFKIKAAAVAIGDTEITLRKPDMTEIKVPIASLSASDQKYIDTLIAKGGPTSTIAPDPPPTEDFQDPVAAGWVTIGAAEATGRVALQPDPIPEYMRLKQGGAAFVMEDTFDRLGAVLPIGGPDAWVLAAVESNHPDETKQLPTRVLWVSLAKQKVASRHLLPLGEIVLDYHAGSRRLLTYNLEKSASSRDAKSLLTLWELTPTAREIKPIVRWNANSDDRHTAPWARVIDANTVVQRWKKQEYVGWDIPGRR